jgi:hypothetical protein
MFMLAGLGESLLPSTTGFCILIINIALVAIPLMGTMKSIWPRTTVLTKTFIGGVITAATYYAFRVLSVANDLFVNDGSLYLNVDDGSFPFNLMFIFVGGLLTSYLFASVPGSLSWRK